MRTYLIILMFFSIAIAGFPQNTWIQRLNFSTFNGWMHSDTLVGVKDLSISPNGTIYVLANRGQENYQSLYCLPANGHPMVWSIPTGSHGGLGAQYARSAYATSDNGVIISYTREDWVSWQTSYGYIQKYNLWGGLSWEVIFDQSPNYPNEIWDRIAYDVIQSSSGNYYALVGDSLFEINANGNIIYATNLVSGRKLRETQYGDLIVLNGNSLTRKDTSGNIMWSQSCSGKFSINGNYVLIVNGTTIKKVDVGSGSIIWTKSCPFSPISDIEATSQGGFLASIGYVPGDLTSFGGNASPGYLVCADSTGDTLWTRKYNFPYYGLSVVAQDINGDILTGGAFLGGSIEGNGTLKDYSSFCSRLDSSGNGALQKTNYMWPGDANNNQFVNFVDDALYMVIANGDTGLIRDTLNLNWCGSPFYGLSSDYSVDWPDTFSNGVNKKYADTNGNGIIDTNDVAVFPFLYSYGVNDSFVVWDPFRIRNPENFTSTNPDFRLVALEDTIAPGDSVHFLIIAGSLMMPVDSLCGLAFIYSYTSNSIQFGTTNLYDCDLGTRGNNLFTQSYYNSGLTCRWNHQSVYNLYDTLGVISAFAPNNITTNVDFEIYINKFKAVTCDGTEVPFNISSDVVVVDPTLLESREYSKTTLKISPNPVSGLLSVSNMITGNKKITVLNSIGMNVKEYETTERQLQIAVDELPDGIYLLCMQKDKHLSYSRFTVKH